MGSSPFSPDRCRPQRGPFRPPPRPSGNTAPSVACTLSSRSLQIVYAFIAFSTFGTSWSMSGSFCAGKPVGGLLQDLVVLVEARAVQFVAHRPSPPSESRTATGTVPSWNWTANSAFLIAASRLVMGRPSASLAIENPRLSVACGPRPTTIRAFDSISRRAASTSRRRPMRRSASRIAFKVVRGLRDQPRASRSIWAFRLSRSRPAASTFALACKATAFAAFSTAARLLAEFKLGAVGDRLHRLLQLEFGLAERLLRPVR